MSHRKFEAPRHGSLAFRKRRVHKLRQKCRSFPRDKAYQKPHLTAFLGFKAGMTHVVREVLRTNTKLPKDGVLEAATVIETPPMIGVGLVGYKKTIGGLKTVTALYAQHINESMKRTYYKRWYKSEKRAFANYEANYNEPAAKKQREQKIRALKKCDIVRLVAHTQMDKLPLKQKKAEVCEIQINGGSAADKVEFGLALLEKEIPVDTVFAPEELIDVIGATKGHGFQGVIKRFGVKHLPRKTHRGLRKVACIGAWHPARVAWTVARAGQLGFFKRTQINKKIYRVGTGENRNAKTEFDITSKDITPMGGFLHYGEVKNDFLLVKGSTVGVRRRVLTLRKAMFPSHSKKAQEKVSLKFIDTSSKMGHGRFQTSEEKKQVMGMMKKDLIALEQKKVAEGQKVDA